jgi:ABC-type polysaccharide/polyol phosphate transport system ATPase subunit
MATLSAPRAVEVENLRKYFTVPGATPPGTVNRLLHPVRRGSPRTLKILDGISFDVRQGELFGIVGRNGSGKTTLLRILASIYRPDAGRVRISGNLAPFIDLGVGFQAQMSARQNVVMNGILLGLGRRELRRRVDAVLDYAELEDFADVQLKNFSSGMRTRLAFASMRQADPDIYLIDEILAVGDEEFREKCSGEFAALKERGKTILMVSHRRGAMEGLADRAMLLQRGRIAAMGEPGGVFDAYRAERLARAARSAPADSGSQPAADGAESDGASSRAPRATIERLLVNGEGDAGPARVAAGDPIRVRIEATASGWVKGPTLQLAIMSADGATVFASRDSDLDRLPVLKPGQGLVGEATVENSLAPGRYRLECTLAHGAQDRKGTVSLPRSIDFEVDGAPREGLVALERTVALNPVRDLESVR